MKSPDLRTDLPEEVELLTIVAEECAELAQECAKHIRFGENASYTDLRKEVADVLLMIDLMHEYRIINLNDVETLKKMKRAKLSTYSNLKVYDGN